METIGSEISALKVSRPSLRNQPFDHLDSARSSRAVASASLARTCEAPSIDVPSTSLAKSSSSHSRVFARRKPARGEEVRCTDETLLLDLQSISPLFHLPLGQAAEKLGLCRTALKNVCRKCGIRRWPFRGRGRRAPSEPPSSPEGKTSSLEEMSQNGFLFSSAESYLSGEPPTHELDGVASALES
ncbi:RWP-RK domain-containing protein [Baffinella frigidus]|nr:RWP-RK domain-containing protein [Cryptophyta sp. CCMP2293]